MDGDGPAALARAIGGVARLLLAAAARLEDWRRRLEPAAAEPCSPADAPAAAAAAAPPCGAGGPHDAAPPAPGSQVARELREDLAADHLVLLFQPIVDLRLGTVREVEALMRWRRRDGELEDGRFLAVAEQVGSLAELDRLALGEALARVAAWRDEGRPLHVAVNLSAHSLADDRLSGDIAALLAGTSLSPDVLTLELSPEALRAPGAAATLARLSARGVRLALDDFADAATPRVALRALHLDALKIDRALVARVGTGIEAERAVANAIALGHSLGLTVVAEGVETAAQLAWLREHGCDAVQGFLLAEPGPAEGLDVAAAVAASGEPATAAAVPNGAV